MMEAETGSIRGLVVDDQRAMRKIIRQLLSQIGVHDVDDAADGEQALAKLHNPMVDKPVSAGELKTQIQPAVGFTI